MNLRCNLGRCYDDRNGVMSVELEMMKGSVFLNADFMSDGLAIKQFHLTMSLTH